MKLILKRRTALCPFAKITKLEHLTPPSLWMIQFHVLHLLYKGNVHWDFIKPKSLEVKKWRKWKWKEKKKKCKINKNVVFVFEQHEIITHLRLEPLGNEGANHKMLRDCSDQVECGREVKKSKRSRQMWLWRVKESKSLVYIPFTLKIVKKRN